MAPRKEELMIENEIGGCSSHFITQILKRSKVIGKAIDKKKTAWTSLKRKAIANEEHSKKLCTILNIPISRKDSPGATISFAWESFLGNMLNLFADIKPIQVIKGKYECNCTIHLEDFPQQVDLPLKFMSFKNSEGKLENILQKKMTEAAQNPRRIQPCPICKVKPITLNDCSFLEEPPLLAMEFVDSKEVSFPRTLKIPKEYFANGKVIKCCFYKLLVVVEYETNHFIQTIPWGGYIYKQSDGEVTCQKAANQEVIAKDAVFAVYEEMN